MDRASCDALHKAGGMVLYDDVGGDATFRRLVDAFYARVEADPLLRPIFPADLGPGKEWQFLFLTQFFGGPPRYGEQRGHPRLRMRHLPFAVSPRMASRWLAHMLAAIEEVGIAEPHAEAMRSYFRQGAAAMVNTGTGGIDADASVPRADTPIEERTG